MLTEKIIAGFKANAKFNKVLFSLMEELKSTDCNLIIETSLSAALDICIKNNNTNTPAYIFTGTDLFYVTIDKKQPIKIQLNTDKYTELKNLFNQEFNGLKGIAGISEENLVKIKAITGLQRFDEQAQENIFALFDLLLSRGRLYEQWRDHHYELSEYSTLSYKQLIAEHLNIIINLISEQLSVEFQNSTDGSELDENVRLINTHYDRKEIYQQVREKFIQIETNSKKLVIVEEEFSKAIDDFFTKNSNEALDLVAPKRDLKAQLDKLMVNSQERIQRSNIRKKVKYVKPGQEKTYTGTVSDGITLKFQEVEIADESSHKNDGLFIALGTTRKEVTAILSKYHTDIEIRKKFAKEIREVFLARDNTHLKHLYDIDAWDDLKDKWQDQTPGNEIEQYCTQDHIFRDYITKGIGQDLPLSDAAISTFADHRKLNIYIWERQAQDRKTIVLKASYVSSKSTETLHLCCTSDYKYVSVMIPYDPKETNKSTRYDIFDIKQIDNYYQQAFNNKVSSEIAEYRNSLDAFDPAHNAFHQKYLSFDDQGAMEFITEGLNDLKKDLHAHIRNAKTYSKFFEYLFEKVNFLTAIGHAVVTRTPVVLNQIEEEHTLLNRRLATQMSDNIRKIPLHLRKQLDLDGKHQKTEAYLIERINNFKQSIEKNRFTFFMWTIGQIDYYLESIKGKEYFDNNKNLFSVIDELAIYYDLTLYYWDEFEKFHSDNFDLWLSDFLELIIKHQLQEKLNSEAIRKVYKPDAIRGYKDKLIRILSNKKSTNAQGKLTANIVDIVADISSLKSVLENSRKLDLTTALLHYMYASLHHMDVFQNPNERTFQWILQMKYFINLINKTLPPTEIVHREFINDLTAMLSEQVKEERLMGKAKINVNLNMIAIIDLIYKNARVLKMTTLPEKQTDEFRKFLFNHHVSVKVDDYIKQAADAQDYLFDEVILTYSMFVKQEFYCIPTKSDFIALQDNFVKYVEQVKKREYLSKDKGSQSKNKKMVYVLDKLNEFKDSAHALLEMNDSFEDDEQQKEAESQIILFKEIYDLINIALLQGMPNNLALREAYELNVTPALDAADLDPGSINKLKHNYDESNDAHSTEILKYIVNPAYQNKRKRKNRNILLSAFSRHVITNNLADKLQEFFAIPDNYSNEYLDFLCGLLDSVTLEIKIKLISNEMRMPLLVDLKKLHAAHALFLNAHCLRSNNLDNLNKSIKNAAVLLLADPDYKIAFADLQGQVVGNLLIELSGHQNTDTKVSKALLAFMGALHDFNRTDSGTILLLNLLNNVFNIPEPVYKAKEKIKEKDVESDDSYCYMLNELDQVFLPLHTCDVKGKTLLHRTVKYNLPFMAQFFITQGMSVAYEDKDDLNGRSSSEYILEKIFKGKYTTNDLIVKEFVLAWMKDVRGVALRNNKYIEKVDGSVRNYGVARQNISYIENVEDSVRNYESDIKGFFSWLTDFMRDWDVLNQRNIFIKQLIGEVIKSTLKGFNAIYLQQQVAEVIKQIKDKHTGMFTRSRLERYLSTVSDAYAGALVPVPAKKVKTYSYNSASSSSTSANDASKEHYENKLKVLEASQKTREEILGLERADKEKALDLALKERQEKEQERAEKEQERAEKEKERTEKEQLKQKYEQKEQRTVVRQWQRVVKAKKLERANALARDVKEKALELGMGQK